MKTRVFSMILVFIIFLPGCSSVNSESPSKILAPKNNIIAVSGKWKIVKLLNNDLKVQEELLNTNIQFSPEAIVMDGYVWKLPNYKLKKVNITDYTLNKYSKLFSTYKLAYNNLDIITVTSKDQYFCELIKINDEEAIIDTQNYIACIEKISDYVDDSLIDKAINSNKLQVAQEEEINSSNLHTGLLLGLSEEEEKTKKVNYKTLWISSTNKKLQTLYETEGIFFPRKTGFWRLNINRTSEKDKEIDKISATEAFCPSKLKDVNVNPLNTEFDHLYKKIVYVCNDYISFETTNIKKVGKEEMFDKRYQIQHVDNLLAGKGINISDLLGVDGEKAIEAGRKNALKKIDNVKLMDYNYYQENYKLYRKTGYWYFKGRIAYIAKDNLEYKDYNISLIPPQRIVFYDNLCVTWKEIKDAVPNATDAYTSPNGDLAVIITQKKILLYEISNGKLKTLPLKRVDIKPGDSVIMAEWVRGKYMDSWNKSFLKNKFKVLK